MGSDGDMGFTNKKTFWIMSFILILGTFLRFIFLDKPEGMWNDEYISWYIASLPLGKNFWNQVFAQCHMPLYYFYLKFFIHFFGSSDLLLRLTSLFAGVFSIAGMYFVGTKFKDKKLGILCASMTAISSFLIYYSQEVRMYQVLFLFSAMSLLFTLKLIKAPKPSNIILYIISNFLILFTHTIGFVFVFFNMVFTSKALLKFNSKYKKSVQGVWIALSALLVICLPLMLKIMTTHSFSQWWGQFTISRFGFLLTDYFSPIVINFVNAPDNFFFNFGWEFIIFEILPTLIAVFGITKAIKTKKFETIGLFYICLATVAVLTLAALSGKLVFITKYTIEIYPILIALAGYGLLEIEKKAWRQTLISWFCFLNLFYIIANPNSTPKMHRSQGHKIVANLIKNTNLNKGDFIILNYYTPDRFEKYFDFKDYRVISMNKANFVDYITDKPYQEVLKNGKALYRPIFLKENNKHFENRLNADLFSKLKSGQKVTIIVLRTVAMYSPMKLDVIANDQKEYKKTPLMYLAFSYLKNETIDECLEAGLTIKRVEEKGDWKVLTFEKPAVD